MDLFDGHRAHAGAGAERQRGEHGQVDEQDLRAFADAHPDHHQGQIGQRRQRPVELHQRVENAPRHPVDAHENAHRHRRQHREEEGAEHPQGAPADEGEQGGNRYAVPYMWGTTGIGYNADKVAQRLGADAPVDSWDLIFKKENISKLSDCGVAMLDVPVEIIPIALHYLGLPPNSKNPADYERAEALLRSIRPYIRYFDSSNFPSDLANGDICAVVGWGGSVYSARQTAERAHNGMKITYSIPREGAPVWMENLVPLKDAPHPQQGYAFIDYILRPEITAKNSNYVGYPNGTRTPPN